MEEVPTRTDPLLDGQRVRPAPSCTTRLVGLCVRCFAEALRDGRLPGARIRSAVN